MTDLSNERLAEIEAQVAEETRSRHYTYSTVLRVKEVLALIAELRRLRAEKTESGWRPTHRHYKGGLYREVGRFVVADYITPGDTIVGYEDANGGLNARCAAIFDGPVGTSPGERRFDPLPSPPNPDVPASERPGPSN